VFFGNCFPTEWCRPAGDLQLSPAIISGVAASVFLMFWTLGDAWRQNPTLQFFGDRFGERPSHLNIFGDDPKYSKKPVFGDKGLPPN
jgi:hypothetical protein